MRTRSYPPHTHFFVSCGPGHWGCKVCCALPAVGLPLVATLDDVDVISVIGSHLQEHDELSTQLQLRRLSRSMYRHYVVQLPSEFWAPPSMCSKLWMSSNCPRIALFNLDTRRVVWQPDPLAARCFYDQIPSLPGVLLNGLAGTFAWVCDGQWLCCTVSGDDEEWPWSRHSRGLLKMLSRREVKALRMASASVNPPSLEKTRRREDHETPREERAGCERTFLRTLAESLLGVRELSLQFNSIGNGSAKLIASNMGSLSSLDLSHNRISDSGYKALASNAVHLTKLDLSYNLPICRSAPWLGKLMQESTTLQTLCLGSDLSAAKVGGGQRRLRQTTLQLYAMVLAGLKASTCLHTFMPPRPVDTELQPSASASSPPPAQHVEEACLDALVAVARERAAQRPLRLLFLNSHGLLRHGRALAQLAIGTELEYCCAERGSSLRRRLDDKFGAQIPDPTFQPVALPRLNVTFKRTEPVQRQLRVAEHSRREPPEEAQRGAVRTVELEVLHPARKRSRVPASRSSPRGAKKQKGKDPAWVAEHVCWSGSRTRLATAAETGKGACYLWYKCGEHGCEQTAVRLRLALPRAGART